MEQDTCSKCGCVQLAHTGRAGSIAVGFGAVCHVDDNYCLMCIKKSDPCFVFKK